MVDPADLRRYIRSVYETGSVSGEGGRPRPLMPVGTPEDQGELIRDLAIGLGAVRTIETGLGLGLSALFLCEAVLSSGDSTARHVTIDPFQKQAFDDAGLVTLRNAGLEGVFEFHPIPSLLVLPRLIDEALKRPGAGEEANRLGTVSAFDLALIDGGHHFEDAFLDIYYSLGLVRPGGLIVVDDMWMPAVRLAVSYFEKNLGLTRVPSAEARGRGSRGLFRRRHRSRAAVLRRPEKPLERSWDSFVPFA